MRDILTPIPTPSAVPETLAPAPGTAGHPALYPALLLHLLISSLTFILAKVALAAMPLLAVALLRFLIASVALAAIWIARGGSSAGFTLRDWRQLAWIGFLAVPCNQGFFLSGLQRSSPAHAALLYSTTPIFVLFLSVLRREERLSWPRVAGILAAVAGVVLVLMDRGLHLDRRYLAGDGLLLLAVIAWALYSVGARALIHRHDAVTVTALSLILGTVMTLPVAPAAFAGFDPGHYTAAVWGSVLFLALVTSVLAYFLWIWCLSHTQASKVAVFTNFQPVVTTLLAFLIFHEHFAPHFFLGGALVLGGVLLTQRS